MKLEDYEKIVKDKSFKDDKLKNAGIAFLSGGLMGILSEGLFILLYNFFDLTKSEANMYVSIIFIVLASVLTGMHVFDKIVNFMKAGIIVPITGFSHSMTSAAIDYKKEGLINGIGSNIFKLTGSVILYSIVGAFAIALIRGLFL